MPGFIAKKLCPQLKIVRGCFDKYREASSVVSILESLKIKYREATKSFQYLIFRLGKYLRTMILTFMQMAWMKHMSI